MAAILKLLKTTDPKTRQYIRFYRISEIYEVFNSRISQHHSLSVTKLIFH